MTIASSLPLQHPAQRSASAAQALHDDIRVKWSKFTDREIGAFKDTDDLVSQVASRYTLDREQAIGDVEALLNGRQI